MNRALNKRHLYALMALCLMFMVSFSFFSLMKYTPFSDPFLMVSRVVDGLLILSRKSGISLERVKLKGNYYLKSGYLLSLAELYPQKPLLQSSPGVIGKNLMKSDGWVREFVVERSFPDEVLIEVKENIPDAFWQTKGRFLSAEGTEMASHGTWAHTEAMQDRLSSLPKVVGRSDHLPKSWRHLREEIGKFTNILSRVSVFRLVNERRWNLVLKSGELIKLPEEEIYESLLLLDKLQRKHQLLERNLSGIDLRFRNRLIIERRERPAPDQGTTVMLESKRV